MKKRILSFILICVMVLSTLILSSCNGETVIEDEPAKVYTLYTICEEGTTQEAIHEVETALNRLTFYNKGLCVKLVMLTADEYDAVIDAKLAEVKAYNDAKNAKGKDKNKNKDTSSAAESSEEVSVDVMTGDDYIELLENDASYEYEFKNPRLDIFLVRGYDRYIDLVGKDQLAALDEKLSSEAKVIRDYVYPTFLDAAKVTNTKGTRKTYGIPMNKGIGEYNYIVFDKEYLDTYQIDASTMTNLEDLEEYLKIISTNEKDVVPLVNVFDSPDFAYLFGDGFPAYISKGTYVTDTYTDNNALNYFTMIARYASLDYLKEEPANGKWAVKFIRGTFEDIDALEIKNGREYEYTIHSYPVATNDDLLSSMFCVSAYTISNELTDVATLLSYIETDPAVANLLAFGVEGTHYTLDDNGQVVRNPAAGYMVDLSSVGNSFLTYTEAGENPDKWEILKQQNIDSQNTADQSVSVGFAYYPNSIKDPNDSSVLWSEPNYVNIIKESSSDFYKKIIEGKYISVSAKDVENVVVPMIKEEMIAEIEAKYLAELDEAIVAEKNAEYAPETDAYKKLEKSAYNQAIRKYMTGNTYKSKIKSEVVAELSLDPEYSGTDTETIAKRNAKANEICTDAYYEERFNEIYAKEIADNMTKSINATISSKVKTNVADYKKTDEYAARLAAMYASESYISETDAIRNANVQDEFSSRYITASNDYMRITLEDKIKEEFVKINDDLRKAYVGFQNEYIARYSFDDDATRSEPDYRTAITSALADIKTKRVDGSTFNGALQQYVTAIVKEKMLAANPDELDANITDTVSDMLNDKWIQNIVIEAFAFDTNKGLNETGDGDSKEIKAAVNEFITKDELPGIREIIKKYLTKAAIKDKYNTSLIVSFEKAVGLIKTVENTVSKDEEPEKPAEGEEKEEDTGLVDINTVELYPIIFEKRIEEQYYAYHPLPTA